MPTAREGARVEEGRVVLQGLRGGGDRLELDLLDHAPEKIQELENAFLLVLHVGIWNRARHDLAVVLKRMQRSDVMVRREERKREGGRHPRDEVLRMHN